MQNLLTIRHTKYVQLEIKELTTITQMLAQIEVMQNLYPKLSKEKYQLSLSEMIPRGYTQIGAFENEICMGITGLWFGTKLWSGKYLEIDNFVVHPDHRSKGIGKKLTDYINQKGIELGCSMIVLDAFTGNFPAHRFYYNQGYGPKGFHFVKILDESKLS